MPEASSREVNGQLRAIFAGGAAGQLGDEQLLGRFLAGRGEAAEAAFAALVDRHGGMVLGVCRRVLGDRHAAEDAFQATFLVLARKAVAVARRERLLPWLYTVALRTAREARGRETRRREREGRAIAMAPNEPPDPAEAGELASILDEELARLPEHYRSAILLCEMEGLSRREAAGRLGVPEATVAGRLARARARLRDALTRRGVAPAGAALTALASEARGLIVSPGLIEITTKAAAAIAAGSTTSGVVSIPVATLTEGVLKAMLIAKLRGVALGLAALGLVAAGVTATSGEDRPGREPGSLEGRIDGVERKLDRILEALGTTGTITPPPGGESPAQNITRPPTLVSEPNSASPDAEGHQGDPNKPLISPDEYVARRNGPLGGISEPGSVEVEEAAQLADRINEVERRVRRLERLYEEQEGRLQKMERRLKGPESAPTPEDRELQRGRVLEPPFVRP